MKNIILLLLAASVAYSQTPASFQSKVLVGPKRYVNSQLDTTSSLFLGAYQRVSLRIVTTDTISVYPVIQKRAWGQTSWTSVAGATSDTLTSSKTVLNYNVVLRSGTVDRVQAVADEYRFIVTFLASGNAASGTNKYRFIVDYK